MSPGSNGIEYTIRQTMFGPIIYVRKSVPDHSPGSWKWGSWRRANDSERDQALIKIKELDR